jgi:hypothetical protein
MYYKHIDVNYLDLKIVSTFILVILHNWRNTLIIVGEELVMYRGRDYETFKISSQKYISNDKGKRLCLTLLLEENIVIKL